jgi:hypothetical protein
LALQLVLDAFLVDKGGNGSGFICRARCSLKYIHAARTIIATLLVCPLGNLFLAKCDVTIIEMGTKVRNAPN